MGPKAGRVVTSGGDDGASGAGLGLRVLRNPRALTVLAFIAFGLLYMVVNAASLIDQRRELGRSIATWQAWALEGTSFAAWLVLLPLTLALTTRLLRRPLWLSLLGHAGGCMAVSVGHTGLMTLLRVAAFALAGQDYSPSEPWADRLIFEARKDIITYVSIVVVFLLTRRLVTLPVGGRLVGSGEPVPIEVRDGSRVALLRPEEIDWVSAAGNYIELHGSFGSELARRTMADIGSELSPHGFVRVHRSRLVRRSAIAEIETRQSGDFDITLRSGVVIGGSRRFRQNLG